MSSPRTPAFLAVLVGSLAVLGVMALHPTGADVLADHSGTGRVVALARAVHAVAIGAVALLLVGMAALSWRLRAQVELSATAFVCFALASFAVLCAAVMSGLVSPALLDHLPPDGTALRDVAMQQLHYTGLLNQAFAKVYVGLAGAAFVLWALAMRRDAAFPRVLVWYSIVAGALPVIGVMVGHLRLNVTGFGLVMLLHTTWMMGAAFTMRRPPVTD
jgi:hypothetical protein